MERLREFPELFELGIHPNLLPGSTHGSEPQEVLQHCVNLVPDSIYMRTPQLAQSTPIFLEVFRHTKIGVDVSIFLPYWCDLRGFWFGPKDHRLIRLPYNREDDYKFEQLERYRDPVGLFIRTSSDTALGFHPVDIYLNSSSSEAYEAPRPNGCPLDQVTETDAEQFRCDGEGSFSAFERALVYTAWNKCSFKASDFSCRTFDVQSDGEKRIIQRSGTSH